MNKMKRLYTVALALTATCGLVLSSQADVLVNDTWQDGTRTDPAAPTYSENGTDSDSDTDLESAWFVGGSGLMTTTVGNLQMSNATTSASHTTYFTPEGSEATLANAGDSLKVTWVFTPRGVNTSNTSQGFALALVNSPSAARLTMDGAPAAASYAGYAMYMNMGQTLKNSNPFQLREWGIDGNSGNILANQGNWAILANGATSGTHGYDSGTSYTFEMTLTLNGLGGLDIAAMMLGGTWNGTGSNSVIFTDSTPNSLAYDTFSIRPANFAQAAGAFDTSLFKVQYTAIPEPSTLMLVGAGLCLMFGFIVRRRNS